MPTIPVNEHEIFYAARAIERQPRLLLIHGAGGSHLDWPPQLRRFDPFGTCAIDLPGHGRSALPACSSVQAYAEAVLALTDRLALRQIILVGHSMGGAIALDIALRHEDRIVGLVLVATGARLKVSQELIRLVEANHSAAVDFVAAAAWGTDASPELIHRASQLMLSCEPSTMQLDLSACNDFDVMPELKDIAMPTLVLVGSEDRMTPPKFGRYLADHIPHAEFVSVAGAGHMLALEQPDIVGDAIRDFIHRRLTLS